MEKLFSFNHEAARATINEIHQQIVTAQSALRDCHWTQSDRITNELATLNERYELHMRHASKR